MAESEVKRQVDILGGGKNKRQFKKPYVINIKRWVVMMAGIRRSRRIVIGLVMRLSPVWEWFWLNLPLLYPPRSAVAVC